MNDKKDVAEATSRANNRIFESEDTKQLPTVVADSATDSQSLLAGIDSRIQNARVGEMEALVRLRSEIRRQDEEAKSAEHLRDMEIREGYTRAGMSVLAILSGTIIVLSGFTVSGCFVLGAGLYGLAPKFIDNVSKMVFEKLK